MLLKAIKMHGQGNDYIFFDITDIDCSQINWSSVSIKWSDRHFGIGADGIVLIDSNCEVDAKMRMFNKDTDYTYSEFAKKFGMKYPDLHTCHWINKGDMTDDEKKEVSGWETMGGYLKTMSYKEAWAEYWSRASEEDKQWFLNLPNFDAEIFKEITGIDVNKPEKMIELSNGKKVSESAVIEALKALTN